MTTFPPAPIVGRHGLSSGSFVMLQSDYAASWDDFDSTDDRSIFKFWLADFGADIEAMKLVGEEIMDRISVRARADFWPNNQKITISFPENFNIRQQSGGHTLVGIRVEIEYLRNFSGRSKNEVIEWTKALFAQIEKAFRQGETELVPIETDTDPSAG